MTLYNQKVQLEKDMKSIFILEDNIQKLVNSDNKCNCKFVYQDNSGNTCLKIYTRNPYSWRNFFNGKSRWYHKIECLKQALQFLKNYSISKIFYLSC